jgi:hypothetical protein
MVKHMTRIQKSLTATAAGIALLVSLAAPGFADTGAAGSGTAGHMQPAHMSQGQGAGPKQHHGHMGHYQHMGMMGQGMMDPEMMGQGMMGPGMMGPGMMGPGMMGPGMMGPGMMGPGMMGPEMMRHGMMCPGMMGPGFGHRVVPQQHLSTDDVRHFFEHRLERHGNKRLTLGEVTQADDDTIMVDITTVDGSLVQRLEVDRHTGQMTQVD